MNPRAIPADNQYPREAIEHLRSKAMKSIAEASSSEARNASALASKAVADNQPSLAMLIIVNSALQLIELANTEFLKECGGDSTRHLARKILQKEFKAKVIDIYSKILSSTKAAYVRKNPLADSDLILTRDEMLTDIETRLKIIIQEKGSDISPQDLSSAQEKIKRSSTNIKRMEDLLKVEQDQEKRIAIIKLAKIPQKLIQAGEIIRALAKKPTRFIRSEDLDLARAESAALYRKLAILSIGYNSKIEESPSLDIDTVERTCEELDSSLRKLCEELGVEGYIDHNDIDKVIGLINEANNPRNNDKIVRLANMFYKHKIPTKFKQLQNARTAFYKILRPNTRYSQFVYTPKNIVEGTGRSASVLGVPISNFTRTTGEGSLSNEDLVSKVIKASKEYQSGVAIAIAKLRPYGYILDKMAKDVELSAFEIDYVQSLDAEQRKVLYVLHRLNRYSVNMTDFVTQSDVWKRAVQKENSAERNAHIRSDGKALRRPLSEALQIK